MILSRQVAAGDANMSTRNVSILIGLLVLWGVGGCGIQTATFPERDPARVWSAMVTAAEEPIYPDWRVIDNEVWTNRDNAEIEIHRVLRRDLVEPGHNPKRESVTWKFQIRMIKGDPPTVRFRSRQIAVPAHVWKQGQQYFDDVAALLGSSPLLEIEVEEVVTPVEDGESLETEEMPAVGTDLLETPSDAPAEDG